MRRFKKQAWRTHALPVTTLLSLLSPPHPLPLQAPGTRVAQPRRCPDYSSRRRAMLPSACMFGLAVCLN
jgi:hypothetical protein